MKKRWIALLMASLLAVSLLSGCGSSDSRSYASSGVYDEGYIYDYDYEIPMAAEEMAYGSAPAAKAMNAVPDSLNASRENGAKLIYTADLDMETLEFDQAVSDLAALTEELGGYYESSSISESGSTRRANYTVRIPAENYRAFLDQVGELCHLLSQQEYTEDVSEAYYDTSGRLETQKTKLARLQELLTEAESMEDIITIESAISETEEMIDRLSGTLRHYDALVDYSTVTVYLREVKVYEPEPDPTYGKRLGTAFVEGLEGFVEGLGDILVALAYSWLWLLLIAGIVILILRLTRKRRAAKRAERAQRRAEKKARKEAPVVYAQPTEGPKEEKPQE